MKKVVNTVMNVIFILGICLGCCMTLSEYIGANNKETEIEIETEISETATETDVLDIEVREIEVAEIETETETEIFYIICDVVEFTESHFITEMPDGELQSWLISMVQDPPIDDEGNPYFETVCFRVEEREYTTHYKVIALR